jgi:hypothetical protein
LHGTGEPHDAHVDAAVHPADKRVLEEADQSRAHMVVLYALWYNFVGIHKTLRVTPAMAGGIADRLCSMEDVVTLIDARSAKVTGETVVASQIRQGDGDF